jgi:hypothetical protein
MVYKNIFQLFTKQATLMRRSTVLSVSPKLVFLAVTYVMVGLMLEDSVDAGEEAAHVEEAGGGHHLGVRLDHGLWSML